MVRLSQLAQQFKLNITGDGDPEITGVTEDSRLTGPGYLFVAKPGCVHDGRDYIESAVKQGAVAVLSLNSDLMNLPVPHILAPEDSLQLLMADLAACVYGHPAGKLLTVAITGTNGKTTTSYLLEAILKKADLVPGVMGTINYRWPGQVMVAPNTTPEGAILSSCLADMVAAGVKSAVLEVSSHALTLGRLGGLKFDRTIFTNLSRDHLDFHQGMEDYFQAKKRLFTKHTVSDEKIGNRAMIINADDEYGERLAAELGSGVLTFGFSPAAVVRGSDLTLGREGLSFTVNYPGGSWRQTSPLLAEINAYNLLGAIALALSLELSPKIIAPALAEAELAPGRLERVGGNSNFLVLVDYAHSPDALAKALLACQTLDPKRILVVFGCGGNRDKGKRALMAQVAGEMADLVVITSDNPRTEEPWAILDEVEKGFADLNMSLCETGQLTGDWAPHSYLKILDRRVAIREAIGLMTAGDILLIGGKGHEDYQIIGREKRHLDDRQEALEALNRVGNQ